MKVFHICFSLRFPKHFRSLTLCLCLRFNLRQFFNSPAPTITAGSGDGANWVWLDLRMKENENDNGNGENGKGNAGVEHDAWDARVESLTSVWLIDLNDSSLNGKDHERSFQLVIYLKCAISSGTIRSAWDSNFSRLSIKYCNRDNLRWLLSSAHLPCWV